MLFFLTFFLTKNYNNSNHTNINQQLISKMYNNNNKCFLNTK